MEEDPEDFENVPEMVEPRHADKNERLNWITTRAKEIKGGGKVSRTEWLQALRQAGYEWRERMGTTGEVYKADRLVLTNDPVEMKHRDKVMRAYRYHLHVLKNTYYPNLGKRVPKSSAVKSHLRFSGLATEGKQLPPQSSRVTAGLISPDEMDILIKQHGLKVPHDATDREKADSLKRAFKKCRGTTATSEEAIQERRERMRALRDKSTDARIWIQWRVKQLKTQQISGRKATRAEHVNFLRQASYEWQEAKKDVERLEMLKNSEAWQEIKRDHEQMRLKRKEIRDRPKSGVHSQQTKIRIPKVGVPTMREEKQRETLKWIANRVRELKGGAKVSKEEHREFLRQAWREYKARGEEVEQ